MTQPDYLRAHDAAQARTLLASTPGAAMIAGGTAAQLGWPEGRFAGPVIDISALPAPAPRIANGALVLSALSRLEDLRRDPLLAQACPALPLLLDRIAAPAVRNLATLGGNIGWRFGDLVPLLLALDARLEVDGAEGLAMETALNRSMPPLFTAVTIPLPLPSRLTVEKIARRVDFAPSTLTIAIAGDPGAERLAVGGAGQAPQLCRLPQDDPAALVFADTINGSAAYRHKLVRAFLNHHRGAYE